MKTAAVQVSVATALFLSRPSPAPAVPADPVPASRAAPAFLALDLEQCAAVPAIEIRNIVDVELRKWVALIDTGGDRTPGRTAPGITTVRLTCDQLAATIDITDPITGKALKRAVDLAATAPVARAHLIALSIVELLSASWGELLSNPTSAASAVGAPAAPEARSAALEFVRDRPHQEIRPRIAWRVLASSAVSSFTGGKASTIGPRLWGGALGMGGDGPRHAGWIVDLSLQHGDRDFTLGRVSVDSLSGLAAAVGHVSLGRLALRGGAGVRGGVAWLSGTPIDAETAVGGAVRGWWWGPAALVDAGLGIGRHAVVGLAVEFGRTLLPVTAMVQGERPLSIGGTWFRGGLGVGFAL